MSANPSDPASLLPTSKPRVDYPTRWRWYAERVANHPDGITIREFCATYGVSYSPATVYLEGAWRNHLVRRELRHNGEFSKRRFVYSPALQTLEAPHAPS